MPERINQQSGQTRYAQILEDWKKAPRKAADPCPCIDCCYEYFSYSLISDTLETIGLDTITPSFVLKKDECAYYKITVTAEWGVSPLNNDLAIDFSNNNHYGAGYISEKEIWLQLLNLNPDITNMTICKQKSFNNGGGVSNIVITHTWILTPEEEDLFLMVNLAKHDTVAFNEPCVPISDFGNYYITLLVEKCPRDHWFNRFPIPCEVFEPTDESVDNYHYGSIPPVTMPPASRDLCEGLPFDGYYHIDLYLTFQEYHYIETAAYLDITEAIQQLSVYDDEYGWFEVQTSALYSPESPTPESAWVNASLHTSAIIKISDDCAVCDECCEPRRIWFVMYMPNGTYKRITGGWAHIFYVGKTVQPTCEWDCSEDVGNVPPGTPPPLPLQVSGSGGSVGVG